MSPLPAQVQAHLDGDCWTDCRICAIEAETCEEDDR